MQKLDAYIGRLVASGALLALLVLLGVLTLFRFIDELDSLREAYGVAEALWFIACTSPRQLYELIPYAAMTGALVGLGRLAGNSELVVMRMAGAAPLRIAWGAVRPLLLLLLLGVLLGEYVVPATERLAQQLKAEARGTSGARDRGEWYREGNSFVRFGLVHPGGAVEHISIHEFDAGRRLKRTLHAARGVHHQPHPEDGYWLLEDVRMTEFTGRATRTARLVSRRWDSSLSPAILEGGVSLDARKLSLAELSRKIDYLSGQGMSADSWRLAFWGKLLQPLATLALVFIAVSFVFGPLRETGLGYRLVAGLLVGIAFKFVQDLLAPASMVFGFPPPLATALPVLVCVLLGATLMYRSR